MGRIQQPEYRALADHWSPVVLEILDEIGNQVWPPKKVRRSLFSKPEIITRYSLEGPVKRGEMIVWALSHTSRPSGFDDRGTLTEGERQFWLVSIAPDSQPSFRIEGASIHERIPAERDALRQALHTARKDGPKVQSFYGNKGPLSHQQ